MSKIKLVHNLRKEIKKLNSEIDLKIIKGLPYKAEARRHKFLVSQFYGFYESSKKSWFKRTMLTFASFVL
jgi:DNA polymerase elongation subunit (family B)